jgi:hypothetical protein
LGSISGRTKDLPEINSYIFTPHPLYPYNSIDLIPRLFLSLLLERETIPTSLFLLESMFNRQKEKKKIGKRALCLLKSSTLMIVGQRVRELT